MTLNELLIGLSDFDTKAPLVFTTDHGAIKGGYHVTELKLNAVSSIDCGARQTSWSEAALQVMDGYGGDHMAIEKFALIVDQSIKKVAGLGSAPLHVEFAHGNKGKRIYEIADIRAENDAVIVALSDTSALCKLATRPISAPGVPNSDGCCARPAEKSAAECCA